MTVCLLILDMVKTIGGGKRLMKTKVVLITVLLALVTALVLPGCSTLDDGFNFGKTGSKGYRTTQDDTGDKQPFKSLEYKRQTKGFRDSCKPLMLSLEKGKSKKVRNEY